MALMLEKETDDENLTYDQVAETIIDLGNRMLAEDESADILEVASGIMAGAVQFWHIHGSPAKTRFAMFVRTLVLQSDV